MLGMDNEHVNDAAAGAEDEVVVQPDEEIIALVMDSVQAEGVAVVDRARVIRALIDNNNEIVNAICSLTSPDGEEVLNSVISQIASR